MRVGTRFIVHWGEGDAMREQEIASAEEGLDVFDLVHRTTPADAPTMIAFSPVGSFEELAVGVGRQLSVLSFQSSLDPPYYGSRGDGSDDDLIWFMYAGSYSEFPESHAVPVESAREAVAQYLKTGRRPTVIEWDEV